jgi:hypothetical protein
MAKHRMKSLLANIIIQSPLRGGLDEFDRGMLESPFEDGNHMPHHPALGSEIAQAARNRARAHYPHSLLAGAGPHPHP